MGDFHCPMGAVFYDDEGCIDCGLCVATTKEQMVEASRKIREVLQARGGKPSTSKKIAICGKGGTGKSTIVTLMANVLGEDGYSVLVMDTDESNPGLYRMFGFDRQPRPLMTLLERFSREPKPDSSWLNQSSISIPDIPAEHLLARDGLRFLMVGKIEDPFQGCACSMADVTREFAGKLLLKDKEVMLADMEGGTESFGRGTERSVDTVLIVVEPSFESLVLAEKISYMAEGIGVGRIRAVLNKIPSETVGIQLVEKLREKKIQVQGILPYDPQVSAAGLEGRPPGDSRAKEEVRKFTRELFPNF